MGTATVPANQDAAKAELLQNLLRISLELSATRDRRKMLEMILREARRLSAAQAGSLYIRWRNRLEFVVAQNDAIDLNQLQNKLLGQSIPVGSDSLAGFVATSGRGINLPDAYNLAPGAPFRINRDFDAITGYRTRSVLAIPLKCPDGEVVGVLQLINRLGPAGTVVPFVEGDPAVMSLASMAAVCVHNALLTDQLKQAHLDSIIRLSVVAEHRDHGTAMHIQRISHLSAALARSLRLDSAEVELIQCASPMHDIGKIAIPDAILLKPGPLTPEERRIVETHAQIGADILGHADNEMIALARDIALCHHERWDGEGYPHRLAGVKIPLAARIVCLADVFDALATPRCYKTSYPMNRVLEIVRKENGRHFDPHVTEAFMAILDDVTAMYAHRDAHADPPDPADSNPPGTMPTGV